MRTDRQTDMKKLISRLSQFCECAKKSKHYRVAISAYADDSVTVHSRIHAA